MKKFIKLFLLCLCSVLALTACTIGGGVTDEHKFDETWSSDDTNHWHACSHCEETKDLALHTWDQGKVTKPATADAEGEKTYTCTVCNKTKVEKTAKLVKVNQALASANNTTVDFTGVVFAVTASSLYVADETAGVEVKLTTAAVANIADYTVGTKVLVTGKVAVSNNQVYVKNGQVVADGKGEALTATLKTIEEVVASDALDPLTYGAYFAVTGAVSKDESNHITIQDDTGLIVLDNAAADFADLINEKVTINLCLVTKATGVWTAHAFVDTAKVQLVDINAVKENVFASVNVPEVVIGKLELTTSYKPEPGVKFAWSVVSGNDALTIENNVVTVNFDITEDKNVTLKLVISSGENTAEQTFNTTVKAVKKVTLAEGKKTSDEYVQANGLVVSRGTADESGTYYYVIVMDEETKELAVLDFAKAKDTSIQVGDRIAFIAKWRSTLQGEETVLRPAYNEIQAVQVKESNVSIDYEKLNPTVLEDLEDYKAAQENNHDEVKLYKIVNPWLVGSGNTTYSWNQFGATKDTAANGIINSRQFSFLIANYDLNGLAGWANSLKVPTKAEGANEYLGLVVYAYSVYQTGATKWSFLIPSMDAMVSSDAVGVRAVVKAQVDKEVLATTAGQMNLPTEVSYNEKAVALTWSTSDAAVIKADGTYGVQYKNSVVTLTATYTIDGVNYTVDVKVNVIAAEVPAITVSEVVAKGSGEVEKLEAYVASIASSSENNAEWRSGLMLTDGKKVIYYSTSTYEVGGTTLAVGDKVVVKGANFASTEDTFVLSGGDVELVSSNNKIDYSELEYVTVTSEEELVAFIGSHNTTKGIVVKFVGPMYFVGTGSTSATGRYQVNYREAASSANARYTTKDESNAAKSLVLNLPQTLSVVGKEWWTDCNMPEKSGSKSYEVLGSFYAVGGYNGNTMHAWTVINGEAFTLTAPEVSYSVNKQLNKLVNQTEFSAGEAGEVSLPQSVMLGVTEYPITWESANEAVIGNDGKFNKVTKEVSVVMTAKYNDGTKDCTWTVTFTFIPKAVEVLTTTQVLAKEDGAIEAFKGYVVGFASGNGGTVNAESGTTYGTLGLYISDGTTVVCIDKWAGDIKRSGYDVTLGDDTTPLAIGDEITVNNVNKVGHSIEALENTTASKTGTATGNWFNPTADTVITNQTEMNDYAKTFTAASSKESGNHLYKVVKVTATTENPVYFGAANAYIMNIYYKTEANKDAAKIDGTKYTLGFTASKACYVGFHTMTLVKALGAEWTIANTCVTAVGPTQYGVTQKSAATNADVFGYGFTGTFYMIYSATGSTSYPYVYHGVLGAGSTLVKVA